MSDRFLILHKGKRTGGTAVAQALAEVEALHVLFDPLHQSIHLPFEQLGRFTSDDWHSHHPHGYAYFASYRELLQDGRIPGVPADVFAAYDLTEHDDADPLFEYLDGLVREVCKRGRTPVLAVETSEGRIRWLRHRFPQAVQIGIVRDRDAQLSSWLQQAAYGDFAFFDLARQLMEANPGWFGGRLTSTQTSAEDLEVLFDRYREAAVGALYRDADAVLDIAALDPAALLAPLGLGSSDNVRRVQDFLNGHPKQDPSSPDRLALIVDYEFSVRRQRDVLSQQHDDARAEADRLLQELDSVRAQRDQAVKERADLESELASVRAEVERLRNQRDAARAEVDELTAQCDAILTSRSWRYTAWLRDRGSNPKVP
jgi:hypothetical protein